MIPKLIIYQLLLRVFGNSNPDCLPNGTLQQNGTGKFSHINDAVFRHLHSLGVTHIWYTGVLEHATKADFSQYGILPDNPGVIKGEAGSPYAIKDYYDVNPYLADDPLHRMEEFAALVERTHASGFKVILDFVPNHLAREYRSDSTPQGRRRFGEGDDPEVFSPHNNFYYLPGEAFSRGSYYESPAKATGNDCFSAHPSESDWYETVKLNYGINYMNGGRCHFQPVPDTWSMMVEVLDYWAAKGVDGFRCDMAEMVPVEFWEWAIGKLKQKWPHLLFVAEVYNPQLYASYTQRGGFDLLYDKVGLYDALKDISRKKASPDAITACWQSLGDMQEHMLHFLENHDEQRIASDFNLGDPFRAIPELAVSLYFNKCPFMLYFGQEVGEKGMLAEGFSGVDGRTSIFDWCSAPSVVRLRQGTLLEEEKQLLEVYRGMLALATDCEAIRSGDTYDLQWANGGNRKYDLSRFFTFARRSRYNIDRPEARPELVIVTVDFSQSAGSVEVNLPEHFFRHWNIPHGTLSPARNLVMEFNRWGVAVYRMEL